MTPAVLNTAHFLHDKIQKLEHALKEPKIAIQESMNTIHHSMWHAQEPLLGADTMERIRQITRDDLQAQLTKARADFELL